MANSKKEDWLIPRVKQVSGSLKGFCSWHGGISPSRKCCNDGTFFPHEENELINYILENAKTMSDVIEMLEEAGRLVHNGKIYNADGTPMLDCKGNPLAVDKLFEKIKKKKPAEKTVGGEVIRKEPHKKYIGTPREGAFAVMSRLIKNSEDYKEARFKGNDIALDWILQESIKQAKQFYDDKSEEDIKKRALEIFADTLTINLNKSLDNGDERTRRLTELPDALTGENGSHIMDSDNKKDTGNTDKLQHFAHSALLSAKYGENLANFMGATYEGVHSLKPKDIYNLKLEDFYISKKIKDNFDKKDIVANKLGAGWAQSFMQNGELISSYLRRINIDIGEEHKTVDDYFNPNKNS